MLLTNKPHQNMSNTTLNLLPCADATAQGICFGPSHSLNPVEDMPRKCPFLVSLESYHIVVVSLEVNQISYDTINWITEVCCTLCFSMMFSR